MKGDVNFMTLMRKLSILLSFAIILSICGFGTFAAEEIIFEENFDNVKVGGYTEHISTGNGEAVIKEKTDKKSDRYLDITDNDDGATFGYTMKFPEQKDTITIAFDYLMPSTSKGGNAFYVYDNDAGFPPAQAVYLNVGSTRGFDGPSEQKTGTAKVEKDKWIRVTSVIETKAGTYSLYFDGVAILKDYKFRNSNAANLTSFDIMGGGGDAPSLLQIDNIKVIKGAASPGTAPVSGSAPSVNSPVVQSTPSPKPIATSAGNTQIVFEEKFDQIKVGEFTENISKGNGVAAIKEKAEKKEDRYLEITDNDDGATFGYSVKFPEQKDTFSIAFDYLIPATSKGGNAFYVYDEGAGFPPAQAVYLNVGSTRGFDGPSEQKTGTAKADMDTWIRVTSIIDPKAGTYSLYFNGGIIIKDYKFRNANATTLSMFDIMGGGAGVPAILLIDNIKVVKGAVTPETSPASGVVASNNPDMGSSTNTSGIVLPDVLKIDNELKAKLEGAIVLMVDYPVACISNRYTPIDSTNTNIFPFVENGRTLVPVRFVSEAFGAKVGWDEATSTVSITSGTATVEMKIGSDMMKVNGVEKKLDVTANTYNDRTFIPLRAMSEAIGKSLFWDDRGLIVISDKAGVITVNDENAIERLIAKIKEEASAIAGGSHSNVYVTSRWYRKDGQEGQLGTLDMLKRFMATGDKWSYIGNPSDIKAIINQGVTFQGAVNANQGYEETWARYFDGSKAVAPWMINWKDTYWSCFNNPKYYEVIKKTVSEGIDNGVTEFHYDDWGGNAQSMTWGACFCEYCQAGFKQYLMNNYKPEELTKMGIADINTFSYKKYLEDVYGINSNASYNAKRTLTATWPAYSEFNIQATRNMHAKLKAFMNEYAKRNITLTHNVYNYGASFTNRQVTFIYDVADGGMGETKPSSLDIASLVSSAYLSKGVGKPFIYSPLPEVGVEGVMKTINQGAAIAYATGQFMLVPWDIWIADNTRYFAKVEETEGVFHFVRQYPFLFDRYETPAKLGLLVNLNQITAAKLKKDSMDTFAMGIPFKDVVSQKGIPIFNIKEKDLEGLSYLAQSSNLDTIPPEERAIIEKSGVKIIASEDIGSLKNELCATAIKNSPANVYSVLRENVADQNAPKVVHILNKNDAPVSELVLNINNNCFYGNQAARAIYYRPKMDPVVLEVVNNGNGTSSLKLPTTEIWGVVRVFVDANTLNESYAFTSTWSGIDIGTRTTSDKAIENGDNEFTLYARGRGFDIGCEVDSTGSMDQMPFVYKNLASYGIRDYDVAAKVESTSGGAGIMLRDNASSNAKFVALCVVNNKLKLSYRSKENKVITISELGDVSLPLYVKLAKRGGIIEAYTSSDGQSWGNAMGNVPFILNNPIAGITAYSEDGKVSQSTFHDVRVKLLDISSGIGLKELTVTARKNTLELDKRAALAIQCVSTNDAQLPIHAVELGITSSNPSVLTVDDAGNLTPVALGDATITVKAGLGNQSLEKSITMTVVPIKTVILEENFDKYDETAIPQGFKINASSDAGGGFWRMEGTPPDTNKTFFIYDNASSSDINATYKFEEAYETDIVVEFDYKMKRGTPKNSGGLVAYLNDKVSGYGVCLITGPEYFWYISDGKFIDITQIGKIIDEKWYKIKIIAYPSQSKADIYIDDVLVADKVAFRTPVTNIGELKIGGNTNAIDTHNWWDNIKVSKLQ